MHFIERAPAPVAPRSPLRARAAGPSPLSTPPFSPSQHDDGARTHDRDTHTDTQAQITQSDTPPPFTLRHRYAASDPGHGTPSLSLSPPASPTSAAALHSMSSSRTRTVPGYRTAHAAHVLPARALRDVRPTSLDAILESMPHYAFPSREGPGAAVPEFGVRRDEGGEGRRNGKGNKLRKARPGALARCALRALADDWFQDGYERTRKVSSSSTRRSPVRRSPSPQRLAATRGRTLSLFGKLRMRTRKRTESRASRPPIPEEEEPRPERARGMERYVVEPFGGAARPLSWVSQEERPLSVTSRESACTYAASADEHGHEMALDGASTVLSFISAAC